MHSISTGEMSFLLKILVNFFDAINMSTKCINRCVYGLATATASATIISLFIGVYCWILSIAFFLSIPHILSFRCTESKNWRFSWNFSAYMNMNILYNFVVFRHPYAHTQTLSSTWMFARISLIFFVINSIWKLL